MGRFVISQKKIYQIGKKYQLDFIILYGSVLQKKRVITPESDIDIGIVRWRKPTAPEEFLQLAFELGRAIRGGEIDLKELSCPGNPLLLFKAAFEGKLVYGDPTKFNHLRAQVYHAFVDAQPLFEMKKKLVARFQRNFKGQR